jgi:hypothetical protein
MMISQVQMLCTVKENGKMTINSEWVNIWGQSWPTTKHHPDISSARLRKIIYNMKMAVFWVIAQCTQKG